MSNFNFDFMRFNQQIADQARNLYQASQTPQITTMPVTIITDPSQIKSEADAESYFNYKNETAKQELTKLAEEKQAAAKTEIQGFFLNQQKDFQAAATNLVAWGPQRPAAGGSGTTQDPLYGTFQTGPRLPEQKINPLPFIIGAIAIFYILKRKGK
jgi:hypothetical protein